MTRRFRHYICGFITLLGLTGCSSFSMLERPAWRLQAENACLARGVVRDSPVLVSAREISGPGICGLTHPFKVTALSGGTVTLNTTQTLGCPMIEALDGWIRDVVQPSAQARFGEPVVRINSMGSYSCRGINNMSGASLSEHAFGNATDISGFVLASGRELNVMRGFTGPDEQESAFLHEVHAGACGVFTTVLGPGYNILHYNHFHLDLAMHGSTSRGPRRYCKPVPKTDLPEAPKLDTLPDPPAIEEEMDIARAPIPEPALGGGRSSFVASVPPPPLAQNSRAAAFTPLPRPNHGATPGIVTFAVGDTMPPPTAGAPRDLTPRRHLLAAPPPSGTPDTDADQGMGGGEDLSRIGDRPPAEIEPAPPTDARPADGDLTSSIRR